MIKGISSIIGSVAGIGTGVANKISAANLKRKADASFPSFADPNETSLLSEVQRKKNSLNSGSMYSSAKNNMENAVSGNTAAAANLAGSGGNSVKALIDSSNIIDEGYNNLLASQEEASKFYYGLDDKLTEKGADRMLQLQMVKNRDNMAQAASNNKMGGEMITGGLSQLGGGGKSTKTGGGAASSNVGGKIKSIIGGAAGGSSSFKMPNN